MLSPDYLKGCTKEIIQVYQELEDSITRDLVRRLMITDFEIPQSAVWQVEKLQEAGKTYDDVLASIGRMTGKSEKELKKLFTDAGTRTLAYDDKVYKEAGLHPLPIKQSPGMLQTLTAGYKKCGKELKNLTLTTANTSQTQFINACDKAYFEITSGAFDYNTAVRRAIESVGKEGAYVLYPSGHRDRLDVAVRRAALTGVSQTCGQLQWDRADEMMCDLVEVTAHYGARPDHAEWQGQIYSRSGKHKDYPDFVSSTGYGTGEGLLGYGCRHSFYPYFEGISSPAYTKAELTDMKTKTVSYNGENVPEYEAGQKQRAMERSIRAEKRTLTALDEAMKNTNDEELKRQLQADFEKHSVKLKGKEAKMQDFLTQTGRVEDRARMGESGFGRGLATKATAANKRVEFIKNDAIIKAESGLPKKVNLPDEKIKVTVNVDFEGKFQGQHKEIHGVVPKGATATNVYAMAGEGTSTPIRDLSRLHATYGGNPRKWQKKSADVQTDSFKYVIHWYENDGFAPPDEFKIKGMKER